MNYEEARNYLNKISKNGHLDHPEYINPLILASDADMRSLTRCLKMLESASIYKMEHVKTLVLRVKDIYAIESGVVALRSKNALTDPNFKRIANCTKDQIFANTMIGINQGVPRDIANINIEEVARTINSLQVSRLETDFFAPLESRVRARQASEAENANDHLPRRP